MFSVSAATVFNPSRTLSGDRLLAVFLIEYSASATPSIGPFRRLALVDDIVEEEDLAVEEPVVRVPGLGTAWAMRGAASKAFRSKQKGE